MSDFQIFNFKVTGELSRTNSGDSQTYHGTIKSQFGEQHQAICYPMFNVMSSGTEVKIDHDYAVDYKPYLNKAIENTTKPDWIAFVLESNSEEAKEKLWPKNTGHGDPPAFISTSGDVICNVQIQVKSMIAGNLKAIGEMLGDQLFSDFMEKLESNNGITVCGNKQVVRHPDDSRYNQFERIDLTMSSGSVKTLEFDLFIYMKSKEEYFVGAINITNVP